MRRERMKRQMAYRRKERKFWSHWWTDPLWYVLAFLFCVINDWTITGYAAAGMVIFWLVAIWLGTVWSLIKTR